MMNKRNTPFRLAWVPENTLLAICAAVLLLVLAMMPAHAANVPTAIYLDGISGNDASDGSTAALAVQSFARAKELATINQGITTIYISGTVTVSGGVSLEGTNAMLVREPSYNAGVLLIVPSGETATFRNITIDGNYLQQVVTRCFVLRYPQHRGRSCAAKQSYRFQHTARQRRSYRLQQRHPEYDRRRDSGQSSHPWRRHTAPKRGCV